MKELQVVLKREVLGKSFEIYGDYENPLFLAKDVAGWIGHSDVYTMLKTVDDDEKLTQTLFVSGQRREMWMLTENGVYEVLMQSRKPIAKEFKKQVKTILKTIRKTGGYVANDDLFIQTYLPFADESTKALFRTTLHTISEQNKLIQKQQNKIQQDKPLVEFAEHVSESVNSIDMATFAKLLYDENIKIGRNRLFAWMKKNKYLMRDTKPYQRYVDCGYFKPIEQVYKTPYGEKRVGTKTLITGKGQIYFTEKLRKEFSR